ncbi:MAG: gas vesicle protein [Planctomycetes bacterium]|nr:gas vesicle protein [Planctomycetota bacterium]MBI3844844.1 gas vesicle protein [Planctomycetota bacterium]
MKRQRRRGPPPAAAGADPAVPPVIDNANASLLDLIDNVLNRGVIVNGEIVLAIADVDLVYLRLSVLLCAADRVLPNVMESPKRGRPRKAIPEFPTRRIGDGR